MPLISLLSFLLLSSLSVSLFLLSRMIPDDAADPRDVYCADAAEEDRETGLQSLTSPAVAWLCRDNARGEVLRERAANRDRAFGDVNPDFASEFIADAGRDGADASEVAALNAAADADAVGQDGAGTGTGVGPSSRNPRARQQRGGGMGLGGPPQHDGSNADGSGAGGPTPILAEWDFRHGSMPVGSALDSEGGLGQRSGHQNL